jgi:hypothetical protein
VIGRSGSKRLVHDDLRPTQAIDVTSCRRAENGTAGLFRLYIWCIRLVLLNGPASRVGHVLRAYGPCADSRRMHHINDAFQRPGHAAA